jgi:hypothetical protein
MRPVAIFLALGAVAHADPKLPAPPPEVASLGGALAGAAKCTGKAFMPDGRALAMTGTLVTRLDLESSWIRQTFTAQIGAKAKFVFEAFTTFDARDKLWHRVMVDSLGSYLTGTSTGPANNAFDFALEGSSALGPTQFRDHTDTTDAKATKVTGERSLDRGKTWQKDYALTCVR